MIAEVYPLTRLPRRFAFFDYRIPKETSVNIGDIVSISLKGRAVLGVVRGTKKSSPYKRLATVKGVEAKQLFSKDDVRRIESISHAIFQSPSNVFSATLQGWKPLASELTPVHSNARNKSLLRSEAEFLSLVLGKLQTSTEHSLQTSSEAACAIANILREKKAGQILILSPTERDAELFAKSSNLGVAAVLHGKTKSTQRRAIIEQWRKGTLKTLIGTRQAGLLPAKNIEYILVLNTGAEEYRMLDRNPRIDSRNAAKLLARQHGARLLFTGPLPRVEALHDASCKVHFQHTPHVHIQDMGAKDQFTGTPLLTETLKNNIEESLSNNLKSLIVYNKKGVAKQLQCRDCGTVPTCGTCGSVPSIREKDLICLSCKTEMWIPEQCPTCGSKKMSQKGIGNKRIKTEFQNAFPKALIDIVDKEHGEKSQADIQIVTEYFFKNHLYPFFPKTYGTVCNLAFDLSLTGEDFRTAEYTAYKLYRLAFFARQQHAKCIVQTWSPAIAKSMLSTEKWLKNELIIRKKYQLPPVNPLFETLDKGQKKTYKEALDDFQKLPDSTIINVDSIDYENPSGS